MAQSIVGLCLDRELVRQASDRLPSAPMLLDTSLLAEGRRPLIVSRSAAGHPRRFGGAPMKARFSIPRRSFLKATAAAATVSAAACGKGPGPAWRVLTEEEAHTLAAVCDRIIPADEDPGATWAGALTFIDRQLATNLKAHRELYAKGLSALERMARKQHGRPFSELPPEAQDALLTLVETGTAPKETWTGVDPREFFDRVVEHTMVSFYGDPRHGGNRDRVSWRMLGMPDPPVRGRLKEGVGRDVRKFSAREE